MFARLELKNARGYEKEVRLEPGLESVDDNGATLAFTTNLAGFIENEGRKHEEHGARSLNYQMQWQRES